MPYSFSQLNAYRTCPRQFEYASVKKIPRSISAGESFGSSVHNCLSKWGNIEMQHGQTVTKKDQLALFQDDDPEPLPLTFDTLTRLWHQSFIVEGYNTKDDADAARAKGEVLMKHFFEWWSTKPRRVLAVESGFSMSDFNTKGRFDRIEQTEDGVHVIDFKTGSVCTQEEVDEDLQLSIYAHAAAEEFGMPCSVLTLLFLHEDGITEVHTSRSPAQLHNAKLNIAEIAEGIEQEAFTPTPSLHVCSRCPYRNICDVAVK